jgi:hypothetical protein
MAFIDLIAFCCKFTSLTFFFSFFYWCFGALPAHLHSRFLLFALSILSDAIFPTQVKFNEITITPGLNNSPSKNLFQNFCLHSPPSSLHTWGSRVHDTLPLEEQDKMSLESM